MCPGQEASKLKEKKETKNRINMYVCVDSAESRDVSVLAKEQADIFSL